MQSALESVIGDLRYAWRGFLRSPGPLWTAVATMALGIGGTTAVFSIVDSILFRGLPYAREDRLVWFGMKAPIDPGEFLLEGDYFRFKRHSDVFDELTSMNRRSADCDLNERNPLRLTCGYVAANFLSTFGLKPHIGRTFTAQEDTRNGPLAAMLSHGFWMRRYGGDSHVLGKVITIDGRQAEIAGVLPDNFELPTAAKVDILLPQQLNIAPNVSFSFLNVFGRLKPGVTLDQARAALDPIYRECLKEVPAGFANEVSFHVSGLRERQVRDYRRASFALLGCVIGVLLIACSNVANLLFARAAARRRELAVRAALGATKWRLMRQLLIESALLGSMGGTVGIALGAAFLRLLVSLAPDSIPHVKDASLDGRVMLFAAAASVLCGLLTGLIPALYAPRAETLNTARTAGGGLRLRQGLVAMEIGLSFVLLSAAGLLIESLWNMGQVNLGFRPDRVVAVRMQLGQDRYARPPRQEEFFEAAIERLRRLPGIRAAALSDSAPLTGPATTMIYSNIEVEGHAPPDPKRRTGGMTVFRTVSPGYFAAMDIPVVRGRSFAQEDATGGEEMAIIDESLARKLFPGEDPIGRRMRSGFTGPYRTIVGISRPAKNASLVGADDPEYYYLWRKTPDAGRRRAYILLRTEADPARLGDLIRPEIAGIDPTLALTITTMDANIGKLIARPRFESLLLALFAALGVLLAAVGQFGVISHLVTQRSGEIGVRMALGATQANIVSMVLRHTLEWTLVGAAAGIAGAWIAGRYLESMLFGVSAHDVKSFAVVFVLLILVSLVAAWQPSRRAAGVDPMRVLRHD